MVNESETTKVSEVFETITTLLSRNLNLYEVSTELRGALEGSREAFLNQVKDLDLQNCAISDEKFISCFNEVLQSFLSKNPKEISEKAALKRCNEEDAVAYEKLLDHFGLVKEIPLPDLEGKTIIILGADYGGMKNMAEWFCQQAGENKNKPEILFLTGHRPAFLQIKEEKDFLIAQIREKIANSSESIGPNELIKSAVEKALGIVSECPSNTKEVFKQALIPLLIMSEVNKVAPNSYQLDGLSAFIEKLNNPTSDQNYFSESLNLLGRALINRVYPGEIDFVDEVAKEFFEGLAVKKEFSDDMGKLYRATTKNNAEVLEKRLLSEEGSVEKKFVIISQQPFCERQFLDICNHFKAGGIKGASFEYAGPRLADKMKYAVNSETVLDILARFVFASNESIKKFAEYEKEGEQELTGLIRTTSKERLIGDLSKDQNTLG